MRVPLWAERERGRVKEILQRVQEDEAVVIMVRIRLKMLKPSSSALSVCANISVNRHQIEVDMKETHDDQK
jgi:hypothetical protein